MSLCAPTCTLPPLRPVLRLKGFKKNKVWCNPFLYYLSERGLQAPTGVAAFFCVHLACCSHAGCTANRCPASESIASLACVCVRICAPSPSQEHSALVSENQLLRDANRQLQAVRITIGSGLGMG